MGLFYSMLGLGLMYMGSFLSSSFIEDYEVPQFPVSLLLAASSGLLEESVFFGIPYYITGNPAVLLGTGIIWSVSHLFNSGVFSIETLSYGGFLFSVPHVFFSIRAWISNKGWFAIAFHSGWNLTILSIYCMAGLRQCSIVNNTFDVLNLSMAISAGIIVYLAYENKKKHISRIFYAIPMAVILVSVMIWFFGQAVF